MGKVLAFSHFNCTRCGVEVYRHPDYSITKEPICLTCFYYPEALNDPALRRYLYPELPSLPSKG